MKTSYDNIEYFHLNDFKLESNQTLKNAFIAYKTMGNMSNPCIVYPTWYSGTHLDNYWLIGENMTLDPLKYFIVIPNMFCNGVSSSPSNQPPPYNGSHFPKISLYDNVVAQHKLVTEHLKIKRIHCVLGWSMGAQQTYQWGVLYSDMIDCIIPFCGSAKTSIHNYVFLEGPKSALLADIEYKNGEYKDSLDVQKGLRAFGRVYAGWGMSQTFYRERVYEQLGYNCVEDFLVGFWEGYFLQKDPNNLLSMLWTWQNGDVSNNKVFNGDFELALKAIKCPVLVMPGSCDLYFPKEDNIAEVKLINKGKLKVIESVWGHWAGGPGTSKEDVKFLDNAIREFFEEIKVKF